MSYLAIARAVVTGYERNESDERSPRLSPAEAERLKARIVAAVDVESYRERITARRPALLTALRKREPVTATTPPAGWDGTLPAACGWPHLCQTLGPCPRYPHAPCRHDGETP